MEPEKPDSTNHILRNNLLLVLGMAVVLGALAPVTSGSSAILFAFAYGGQVVVNVILGFANLGTLGRNAASYFLSALLVLIIGFGACSFMLMGMG